MGVREDHWKFSKRDVIYNAEGNQTSNSFVAVRWEVSFDTKTGNFMVLDAKTRGEQTFQGSKGRNHIVAASHVLHTSPLPAGEADSSGDVNSTMNLLAS